MEGENRKLNINDLSRVAGGTIRPQGENGFQVVDPDGNAVGYYNTLEEAEFYASHICPRCRKVFPGDSEIAAHIKAWADGQK